jgi:hypothetical protein
MRHLLPLFLLLALPAAAQEPEPPACTDARAGAVACMAGKLCSCGYQRGGVMSGRPEGWRWDCGVLRPACGEALPPAGMQSYSPGLPPLYLDLPRPRFTPR